MKKSITIFIFPILFLAITACNKIKKQTKRLSEKENWSVEVYIDNVLEYTHSWSVPECDDPFDELCQGLWLENNQDASFYWQFQEKSEQFEIQKIDEEGDLNAGEVMLHNLVYQLSGVYSVDLAEKESYVFSATQINGFENQSVRLELK